MKYLLIDAALHGTGIRDYYEGGYIDPDTLGLNDEIIEKINKWLLMYENEHYDSFENLSMINTLDNEGIEIAGIIKKQLPEAKIDYYSAAKLIKVSI